MPLERLKAKTTLDILWLYILRLLREREMYAYEIRSRIRERFGFEPALVTSYVVLYRLEKAGYVEAQWRAKRKFYRMTGKGERLYQDGIAYLTRLMEALR